MDSCVDCCAKLGEHFLGHPDFRGLKKSTIIQQNKYLKLKIFQVLWSKVDGQTQSLLSFTAS